MNIGEWAGLASAAGTVLGGGGWFVSRATVKAAQATAAANQAAAQAKAAPALQGEQFRVLQATVSRVDKENGQLRTRMSRLELILRAFSRTTDRWARQMADAGIEPVPVEPLVDEYNRTGV